MEPKSAKLDEFKKNEGSKEMAKRREKVIPNMSSTPIPFDSLLHLLMIGTNEGFDRIIASPFLWNPTKIYALFSECSWTHRKGKPVNVKEMEYNSNKLGLLGKYSNWKEALAENTANTSTEFVRKSLPSLEKWDENNISHLFEVLCQHVVSFEDRVRHKDEKDNEEVQKVAFVRFWTSKFPLVVFFILKYPDNYISKFLKYGIAEHPNPSLENVLCDFLDACANQVSQGDLLSRYRINNDRASNNSFVIEFRRFPPNLLNEFTYGKSAAEICIDRNSLNLRWYEWFSGTTNLAQPYDISSTMLKSSKFSQCDSLLAMFVTNTSTDLNILLKKRSIANNTHVMVFCSMEDEWSEEFIQNFRYRFDRSYYISEEPLSPLALSFLMQNLAFRIQGCKIYSQDLFQNGSEFKDFLLSLQARDVNDTLKQVQKEMFRTATQSVPSYYISRTLYHRSILNLQMFQTTDKTDLFFIFCCSNSDLESVLKPENVTLIKSLGELEALCLFEFSNRIFIVELKRQAFWEAFGSIFASFPNTVNAHVVEYIEEDKFRWLKTYGNILQIEKHFTSETNSMYSEQNFEGVLERIQMNKRHNCHSILAIVGTSGIGKSTFLAKMATNMKNTGRIIANIDTSKFVELLKSKKQPLDKPIVLDTLSELISSRKLERFVAKKLLEIQEKVRFEIMLEDIDRVELEDAEFIMDSVKIISEFSNVRIWITARTHFLNRIVNKFAISGFSLVPFSETDTSKYFDLVLDSQFLGSTKKNKSLKYVLSQNKPYVVGLEMAKVPLICQTLCKICSNKAAKDPVDILQNILFDVHEKIVEDRLKAYFVFKIGIYNSTWEKLSKTMTCLVNEMKLWHAYYAVKYLFGEDVAQYFQHKLLNTGNTTTYKSTIEKTLLDIGLLANTQPLVFMLESLSEYFVAHYLSQCITTQHTFVSDALSDTTLRMIFSKAVSTSYAEDFSGCFAYNCNFKYVNLCKFLDTFLGQFKNGKEIEVLNNESFVVKTIEELESELLNSYSSEAITLVLAVKNKYFYLLTFLLTNKIYIQELFYMSLMYNKFTFSQYVIDGATGFSPDNWNLLQENNYMKQTLFHWLVLGFFRNPNDTTIKNMFRYIHSKNQSLVEENDGNGRTALMALLAGPEKSSYEEHNYEQCSLACRNANRFELLKLLVNDMGSNVNARDSLENNVFHYVQNISELKLLFEKCRDKNFVNLKNKDGTTALHMYINFGVETFLQIISFLKEQGVDLNVRDNDENNIIFHLIQQGASADTIRKIIANGVDVGYVNKKKQSMLHIAVRSGNLDLIRYIVGTNMIDTEAIDAEGHSAFDYDADKSVKDMLQFRRSLNDIHMPIPCLPENFVNFFYDFNMENEKEITIVTGKSGAGKSTFLIWLAHELALQQLVLFLDIAKLPNSCFCNENFSKNDVVPWLVSNLSCSDAQKEKILYTVLQEKMPCAVFIDGFDEINEVSLTWAKMFLEAMNEFLKDGTGIAFVAMENITCSYYRNSVLPKVEMFCVPTQPLVRLTALLPSCFTESSAISKYLSNLMTPLEAKILSRIATTSDTPNNFMNSADLFKSFIYNKTLAFVHEKSKVGGYQSSASEIDTKLVERWCHAIKLSHLILSLETYYDSQKFSLIIDLINDICDYIHTEDLLKFGIVKRSNESLIYTHKSYSDYFIAYFLSNFATSKKLPNRREYCEQVVDLFVSFIFGFKLDSTFDECISAEENQFANVLKYEVLDNLLKDKTINRDFICDLAGSLSKLKSVNNLLQLSQMIQNTYKGGFAQYIHLVCEEIHKKISSNPSKENKQ